MYLSPTTSLGTSWMSPNCIQNRKNNYSIRSRDYCTFLLWPSRVDTGMTYSSSWLDTNTLTWLVLYWWGHLVAITTSHYTQYQDCRQTPYRLVPSLNLMVECWWYLLAIPLCHCPQSTTTIHKSCCFRLVSVYYVLFRGSLQGLC